MIFNKCTQLRSHYNPVLEYLHPLESSSCQSASHSPPAPPAPGTINDPFSVSAHWPFTDISYFWCSVRQLCPTLCNPHRLQHARLPCPSPSPGACSNSVSIESVMPSNHLIPCHPLFLLPSIVPSIRVFSNELALGIRWPKYWSFSISPSNEYSELISFRIEGLVRLLSKRLSSLLQHRRSKVSVL